MRNRVPPPLIVAVLLAGCAGGCGLPRHAAPRPDHDLPGGFSSSYRRTLLLNGEIPPGPVDREELGLPPAPGWFPPEPAAAAGRGGLGDLGDDVPRPLFPDAAAAPRDGGPSGG